MPRCRPALCFSALLLAVPALADPVQTSAGPMQITAMAEGFLEPWAVAFLPDGSLLVTERGGSLTLIAGDSRHQVQGLPAVAVEGQGGLLDVWSPGTSPPAARSGLPSRRRRTAGPPPRRGAADCHRTAFGWRGSRPSFWATAPRAAATSAQGWSRLRMAPSS